MGAAAPDAPGAVSTGATTPRSVPSLERSFDRVSRRTIPSAKTITVAVTPITIGFSETGFFRRARIARGRKVTRQERPATEKRHRFRVKKICGPTRISLPATLAFRDLSQIAHPVATTKGANNENRSPST
jgi:hypothetical protein